MDQKYHLAIDIGASGGRHILGFLEDGKLCFEEVHRFPNGMTQIGEHLCWDLNAIFNEILTGMKKCAESGRIPTSAGIDTWGVDFVLLDNEGSIVGPTVAYRDSRTNGMDAEVYKCVTETELYKRTGIQKMLFNTIYQVMALKIHSPKYLCNAARLLFLPDYLHYKLSGILKTEYTIASTGGLLNAKSKTWDDDIIARCGFPREIFGEIVPAGTILGGLTDEIKEVIGYDCTIIMPPSHDTASAFLAAPAKSDRSVYISSGTWSLMGVELSDPITTEESRLADFTNEGGHENHYRYLKNIAGLWLIQSVRKEIGNGIGYDELVTMARSSDYDVIFNVNDERFAAPDSMVATICSACRENGQDEPKSLGDFARSIYRSLAISYAQTLENLRNLTNADYDGVNIIGGGSQNEFLNELTAKACGLPVYAGPAEGTALGSIAAQMLAMGILPNRQAARDTIRRSFDVREVLP